MSLNKFTDINEEHKWMNLNCNSLKVNGTTVASGSVYSPVKTSLTAGVNIISLAPEISYLLNQDYMTLTLLDFTIVVAAPLPDLSILIPLPNTYQADQGLEYVSVVGIGNAGGVLLAPSISQANLAGTGIEVNFVSSVAISGIFSTSLVITLKVKKI
jgi:hypothetical protein